MGDKVLTDEELATIKAPNSIKARTKFASRKFTVCVLTIVLSYLLAWFKPDMMTGQVLFNFWIFVIGIYAGANVGELIAMKKGK